MDFRLILMIQGGKDLILDFLYVKHTSELSSIILTMYFTNLKCFPHIRFVSICLFSYFICIRNRFGGYGYKFSLPIHIHIIFVAVIGNQIRTG